MSVPRALLLAFALALGLAGAAQAQSLGRVQSPILTIESDRLFNESLFGRRVAAEIEADSALLAAENRRIEAELIAEERALTDQRASTDPQAFRVLADAFDEKVRAIRREQDAKARDLGQRTEELRRNFLQAAQPVLEGIMVDAGAAVMLERRNILLAADVIDVTDLAIERINASIGEGGNAPDK
jgi:Skp family chaperone for outer membrane proteins